MNAFLRQENQKVRDQGLWRTARVPSGSCLNFSTNDYLGYSRHPEVVRAACQALERYGAGARSSRLISGTSDLHAELEAALARFKGTEAALVFPTGFMANVGVISALLGPGDAILMDRLNHASLIDAAKLSRARLFVYDHASAESLERALKRVRNYPKRLVVTDSVFSMDGDMAPLPLIVELCKKYGAWLMVDDAHALGVFGVSGSGLDEHFDLRNKIDIVVGTCSKALGSQGGFACGSSELIDFLVNRARAFIFTTALAPAACGAALASLQLIGREPQKRAQLLQLAGDFNSWICEEFQQVYASQSQIAPIILGEPRAAMDLSQALSAHGIFAPAIRPPTVPNRGSRLRFSLTSEHTPGDIQRLKASLQEFALAKVR